MNTTDSQAPVARDASARDPFAPGVRAVRVLAGIGLPVLAVACVGTFVVLLRQSYAGDGVPGPLADLAMWSLGLSGLVGLWALGMPRDAVGHRVRCGAVLAQYALAVAAPLLAAVDFA
ncbi:hypothetical protein ACGF5F_20935 [Streptomyces sp. NPDC047821]|uniref:hypothetical protein n=1 Tax=unclassified Streptomyces TaxID=2593676 RepID=UPI00363B0D26